MDAGRLTGAREDGQVRRSRTRDPNNITKKKYGRIQVITNIGVWNKNMWPYFPTDLKWLLLTLGAV